MAVAFDAFSANAAQTTGDFSWTHTPVGTPKGVIVFVLVNGSVDRVDSVTYGGSALTEMAGSPNLPDNGSMVVHGYFLGASVPAGAQTVEVLETGGDNKRAGAITLTADTDVEIVDVDATIDAAGVSDVSVVLSLGGRTCFCAIGGGSGEDAVGSTTPLTSWTSRVENDFGLSVGLIYTYDTIGTADVTAGWTQTNDTAVAIAVAVAEVATGDIEITLPTALVVTLDMGEDLGSGAQSADDTRRRRGRSVAALRQMGVI